MTLDKDTVEKAVSCTLREYEGQEIDDEVMEILIENIRNIIWAKDLEESE